MGIIIQGYKKKLGGYMIQGYKKKRWRIKRWIKYTEIQEHSDTEIQEYRKQKYRIH